MDFRRCLEVWRWLWTQRSSILSCLSESTLRNLASNVDEERRIAVQEVKGVVESLAAVHDHTEISSIIALLASSDFAQSQISPNHRKGGLLGLEAATEGLASRAAQYLKEIVPPVVNAFADQDNGVRCCACEAILYIGKVVRGELIALFFNDILYDALWKLSADSDPDIQSGARMLHQLLMDIVTESDQLFRCSFEDILPLLRERMNHELNPLPRGFLVGWIIALNGVPDTVMLNFLPDFLDELLNMLSANSHETQQKANKALTEFLKDIKVSPSVDYGRMTEILVQKAGSPHAFTRLTSITWVNQFVKLGSDQLVPYYSGILGVVLPAISDEKETIRVVARETNDELRARTAEPSEEFDIAAVLVIARRELGNNSEVTRLEALRWISVLLERYRTEVLSHLDDIFPALLTSLFDTSDEVALLVLEVQACIAQDAQHFRHSMSCLVHHFNCEYSEFLERRGTLALRRLCKLLDAERVYRELATILEGEEDLEFAAIMVQAVNLILLTAPELADLSALLKGSSLSASAPGRDLFGALYASWCHSPMATVSLCLLAQAYLHASCVIQLLGESPDISHVNLLVQADNLVRLLDTPVFASLRWQLIEPTRYPQLRKTLDGLLMLLPQQSSAFKTLRTRLKIVPSQTLQSHGTQTASNEAAAGIDFAMQVKQFKHMLHRHRLYRDSVNNSKPPRKPPVVSDQNGQRPESDRPDS